MVPEREKSADQNPQEQKIQQQEATLLSAEQRIQKARQKIVNYLSGIKPGDPRFEAFNDYVEYRKIDAEASLLRNDFLDPDETQFPIYYMIINRIREDKSYRRAYQELIVTDDYWTALRDIAPNLKDQKIKFVQGLQEIKVDMKRNREQPQTPPQQ